MQGFLQELNTISRIDILISKKERIKNLVIEPGLNWEDRMILYKKVHLINERIQKLQGNH